MPRTLAIAAIAAVTPFATQIVLAQNFPQDQGHGSVPEQVKSGLEKSGFTNIQGVPDAFVVRAIDPDGNPVTLVVNADSFKDTSNENGGAKSDQREGQTTRQSTEMTGNLDFAQRGEPKHQPEVREEDRQWSTGSAASNSYERPAGSDLAETR